MLLVSAVEKIARSLQLCSLSQSPDSSVLSSVFRTFIDHLVIIPLNVAYSSRLSAPIQAVQCA